MKSNDKIALKWQVGYSRAEDKAPAEFVPATVPGGANLDWGNAKGLPDWRRDDNFKQWRWMEDVYWIYRTQLPEAKLTEEQELWFICGGIDYQYKVYIKNELRYEYEGMFKPFELNVTADMGKEMRVVIFPAPKNLQGEEGTREEASQCAKPAVSYGWDWHPRLIPLGIWEETGLEIKHKSHIIDAEVLYTLNEDRTRAEFDVRVDIQGDESAWFELFAPDGSIVLSGEVSDAMTLDNPILWWCNGYGSPNLYSWRISLIKDGETMDERRGRIGFRTITLEMNEGSWLEPADFPKTCSPVPITISLNGVPLFCKGTNWVNPEVFPGTITRETYDSLLKLARDAHMNLLRVWGGGIVNKDSFFDICDELGLMVWQEFPLACNDYRGTPGYLKTLEREAQAIIKRLRGRASLVLWCGGNELFNNWSGMTVQSHALRLLNSLCYQLDGNRPFLSTSPLNGMAHGCYLFKYIDGREIFEVMPSSHYTAYTEFGVPSLSNMEVCLAATDMENLFPFENNEITRAHHAFEAWSPHDSWSSIGTIRSYFGEEQNLNQLIDRSQWLQSEGYKCIYEEARRQKPYCSMALNWCFNEPWPTIANNSLVNWPAVPKPAYYAVLASCRPQLASARIRKFTWNPGETFEADLYLLNDSQHEIPAGELTATLEYGGKSHLIMKWAHNGSKANQNLQGPTIRYLLPKATESYGGLKPLNGVYAQEESRAAQELVLRLECGELSSEYHLIIYGR